MVSTGLHYDKILLFGDSLTERGLDQTTGFAYCAQLQHDYTRKLDVLNRGFSGYNSEHARFILPEIFKAENRENSRIILTVIFFGTNDASTRGIQHIEVSRFKENLSFLIEEAFKNKSKVIIIGPPIHGKVDALQYRDKGYAEFSSNRTNRKYSVAAKEVSERLHAPFIDLYNIIQKEGNWSDDQLLSDRVSVSMFLNDGIHFTPRAYRLLYDALTNAIEREYPELSPVNIPQKLPYYCDIPSTNVENILKEAMRR